MLNQVVKVLVPNNTKLLGWTHDPTETYPNGWVSVGKQNCEEFRIYSLIYGVIHVPYNGKLILECE